MHPIRIGSYGSPPSHPAWSIASAAATSANWEKRSSRRISLADSRSLGSKSLHDPAPSTIPQSPAAQRPCRAAAPTPSGVTAPSPVMTTWRFTLGGALRDQIDRVTDRLELLHVLALEHDAVLVLDDLG